MALISLGKVTVSSAGTPVIATTNQTSSSATFGCHAFMIEAWPTNTGLIYIGTAGMNKTTGVGVLAILGIPTDNTIPTYSATVSYAPQALNLTLIYIDAAVSGNGALVSAVRA